MPNFPTWWLQDVCQSGNWHLNVYYLATYVRFVPKASNLQSMRFKFCTAWDTDRYLDPSSRVDKHLLLIRLRLPAILAFPFWSYHKDNTAILYLNSTAHLFKPISLCKFWELNQPPCCLSDIFQQISGNSSYLSTHLFSLLFFRLAEAMWSCDKNLHQMRRVSLKMTRL